jgi:endonuclease G
MGTVLDKGFFVVNHNDNWKIPFWVAYYLSTANLQGNQTRTDDFRADPQLALGLRGELSDYRHSGYDRGHNAPAADFKRGREAMSTTFLLSNMCPQTPALNRRIWAHLEEEVRDLVQADGEAWVVTGNLFLTTDSQFVPPSEFIGTDRVAVPTHCFKAILASRDDGTYVTYAFLMPNQRTTVAGDPKDYIISVDRLEEISGYDFFPDLPDDVENVIEARVADVWPL